MSPFRFFQVYLQWLSSLLTKAKLDSLEEDLADFFYIVVPTFRKISVLRLKLKCNFFSFPTSLTSSTERFLSSYLSVRHRVNFSAGNAREGAKFDADFAHPTDILVILNVRFKMIVATD